MGSIWVWWRLLGRAADKASVNIAIFLICLGICDLAIILLFFFNYTIPTVYASVTTTIWYANYYSYFGFPTFFLFTSYSVWFIVAISSLRFLMIMFPMHRFRLSKGLSYKVIAAVLIFGFVVNTPHFLTLKPKQEGNSTTIVTLSEFGRSVNVMNYNFWSHCALFVVTPWFIIVTLNMAIIRKLRSLPVVNTSNPKASSEKQATYVLLTVTFTFLGLLCWQCLSQCLLVIKTVASYSGPEWFYMEESMAYSKLGVVINSCLNCVLYCLNGKRFREEVGKLIGKNPASISSLSPAENIINVAEKDSVPIPGAAEARAACSGGMNNPLPYYIDNTA